jgi:hypothetical protein
VVDGEELEFKKSFVEKFTQAFPGRKVLRLYQAENRFDSMARSELYKTSH